MDTERLTTMPVFSSLPDSERRRIARWLEEREVPEGTELLKEGKPAYRTGRRPPWVESDADAFFVIEDGFADVTHAGEPVKRLGAGDVFGEIGLLAEGQRVATVTAATPMRLIVASGALQAWERDAPGLVGEIRTLMARRLSELEAGA
jgi:CRP-like cAMP-binding protein